MRPLGIAPQITPVSVARVDTGGLAPGQRLPACSDQAADTRGIRTAGIGGQEILVTLERVAGHGSIVGLVNRELANRPAFESRIGGLLVGWSRGVGAALQKHERARELRGAPRHVGSARRFIDTQANAIEHLPHLNAALPQHFGQSLAVDPVGLGRGRPERAWRSIEGQQGSGLGVDKCEASGQRIGRREGRLISCIEHDDARQQRNAREGAGQVGNPDALDRNIRVALELRIDGHEIVVAFELHRIAGQVNEDDAVWPELGGSPQEIPEGAPNPVAVEVARARHVEPGGRQGLGDQPRIIGSRRIGSCRISAVADH